jgi:hypothetical protein
MKRRNSSGPTETYSVKLWITNVDGFREQITMSVSIQSDSKNNHSAAEKIAVKRFAGARPEVVSVTYQ